MRALADASPPIRSAFTGAVFSPACFQFVGRRVFSDRCIWGCGALGTWRHICWDCDARGSNLGAPDRSTLRRFGWIFDKRDEIYSTWIGDVVAKLWDSRYGSRP